MSEDKPYPNTGKLYAALKDFRLGYCAGMTKLWPQYWKEFADQAFADLIALEVEESELKTQLAEAREVIEFYSEFDNYKYFREDEKRTVVSAPIGEVARAFLAKYPKGD